VCSFWVGPTRDNRCPRPLKFIGPTTRTAVAATRGCNLHAAVADFGHHFDAPLNCTAVARTLDHFRAPSNFVRCARAQGRALKQVDCVEWGGQNNRDDGSLELVSHAGWPRRSSFACVDLDARDRFAFESGEIPALPSTNSNRPTSPVSNHFSGRANSRDRPGNTAGKNNRRDDFCFKSDKVRLFGPP